MLNVLRHKKFSKIILWFISAIIITSFAFFGTAVSTGEILNSAGKIFGKNVSASEFRKAYLDSRDQAIMMYGDQFFKIQSMLELEAEAWNRLILLHEAKRRRISVEPQEIVNTIAAIPFFQKDGRFSRTLYNEIVRNPSIFGRKPKDFEQGIRNQLTIRKMLQNAVQEPIINDSDIRNEFALRKEKVTVSYAILKPGDYITDAINDAELKQYYEENKETFQMPETVNVSYIHLTYPEGAAQDVKDGIDQKAIKIAKEAMNNFEEAAKNNGVEIKVSGFFSMEEPLLTFAWSPELIKEIFTLKQGKVIGPKQAPDGWQIIKLTEKKNSETLAFEQVKDQIKTAAINNKGFNLAQAKAQEILNKYNDALKNDAKTDFKSFAQTQGLTFETSPAFSRIDVKEGILAELLRGTLTLNADNRISAITPTSQGPAIIYWEKADAINEKELEEQKEDLRQMLASRKKQEAFMAFMTKLKLEANLQSKIKPKALTN